MSNEIQESVDSLVEEIAKLKAKLADMEVTWRPKKHHTDETKAKISAVRKGFQHSEETRKKMSESKRGVTRKPFTDEHKAKIGAARAAAKVRKDEQLKQEAELYQKSI
jgi:hypothetical protein